MNLKILQRRFAVPAVAGIVALRVAAFSAAAQPTNGTDLATFQVISQRNIFDPNRVAHARFNSSRAGARGADSFSFLGTMSYEKGSFAFFDGTNPDFRKVLELDGDIAGFKVTALAPKSVTLLSGTNEIILPVGTQVRRDNDGHWMISTEPTSYSSPENSSATGSGRHHQRQGGNFSTASTTDNSPANNSTTTDSGTDTNVPDASTVSGAGANDALTRLMQQRAQEEQQLGSGQ
jgi:hypothetical protein